MATTPNYSFSVYSSTDTDVRFLDFRVATAGSQSTSNFYVIDTVLKQHSDAIDSINATPSAFVVKGTYSSGSLYTASVANYPGYKNEQLIVLSLNQKNTGAVQININGTTNKDVMKYGSDGVLKAVDAGDFIANSPVLCLYDGTRFVVIGITSASSITVTGEAGDILQIADDGTIESSGKKAAQPNGIATLDENGNVVQVANMANSAAAVYSGEPVTVEYAGAQRIASITAYGENAQGGTTEAPVALTGISSVTVNDDVTELPIPRPLRRVGDVKDKCVTRQKHEGAEKLVVTYNVGYIASYAGESITTAWISSTGALSTGAEVAYVLSSPETYATDPLDIDNAAGPLTVMTGGELEVRMTELVGMRSDVSNNTVAFSEASQDADITSGEKLSVLFGKIKKRFSVVNKLVNGAVYPNLLDNSDFTNPVNQRGSTSYSGGGTYCIDRWDIASTATVAVVSDGIKITATTLSGIRQKIENITDGQLLVFQLCDNADTVYTQAFAASTTQAEYTTDFGKFRFVLNSGGVLTISILLNAGERTFKWAKLEKGSVATPYVPKGYNEELTACLRYYQRLNMNFRGEAFNVGDGEKYFTTVSFYPMRVVPTITIASAHYWGGFSGLTCSIPQIDRFYNDRTLQLAVNATASNPGGAFVAVIVLEAEL